MPKGFSNSDARALIAEANGLLAELDSLAERASAHGWHLRDAIAASLLSEREAILSNIPLIAGNEPSSYLLVEPDSATTTLLALARDTSKLDCTLYERDGSTYSVRDVLAALDWGLRLSLAADGRDSSSNLAISSAYAKVFGDHYEQQRAALAQKAHEVVPSLTDALALASNPVKWLFTAQDLKEEAEAAYGELRAFIRDELSPGTRSLSENIQALDAPSIPQAIDWYKKNEPLARATIEAARPGCLGEAVWPFSSADAEGLLQRGQDLLNELQGQEEWPGLLKRPVEAAAKNYAAKGYMDTLADIPVEELSKRRKGIRVKALIEAGYTTVADVCAESRGALESVNGIGWNSAYDAKQAADEIAEEAKKNVKLKLSVDNKTPAATRVVCAAYPVKKWRELWPTVAGLAAAVSPELDGAQAGLAPALLRASWLFASGEPVERAVAAHERLEGFLAGLVAAEARATLAACKQLLGAKPTPDEAWADFAANPVAYTNVIEELVPGLLGNDDTLFGLPEDLAREIQDECFFPEGLTCTLRRYQEWGVKYILHQKRSLLGDEMGLGKTVQAIAAMVSLKNTGEKHFLVVCPASVLENWCREIRKHSKLRAIKVHGPYARDTFKSWVKSGGVAVTTYETTGKLSLAEDFSYGLAVIDEAHYIKNPDTRRSVNTLALLGNANRTVFMTGTALENKVDEMLTLIGYLNPEVAARAKPLAFMVGAQQFRDEVAPVYYRRKREDVLTELPELIENEDWCTLGAEEREVYERDVLSRSFMASRRVSWSVGDLSKSCKAKRLLEIVEDAKDDGRKVLVFTFFLEVAAGIADMLGRKCVGIINGSVPAARRQEIIEEFDNAAPGSVLVAQIQSGGTGLNIQSASVVVFCEPQYKPSIENQAVSRAYRMGQTRTVLSHRLLCEDTVDERLLRLIRKKQEIFDAFADKSSAAAAAAQEDIKVDKAGMGKIIEEEIERIKRENPDLAAKVERERAAAQAGGGQTAGGTDAAEAWTEEEQYDGGAAAGGDVAVASDATAGGASGAAAGGAADGGDVPAASSAATGGASDAAAYGAADTGSFNSPVAGDVAASGVEAARAVAVDADWAGASVPADRAGGAFGATATARTVAAAEARRSGASSPAAHATSDAMQGPAGQEASGVASASARAGVPARSEADERAAARATAREEARRRRFEYERAKSSSRATSFSGGSAASGSTTSHGGAKKAPKFCIHCGKGLPATARFCSYCGGDQRG